MTSAQSSPSTHYRNRKRQQTKLVLSLIAVLLLTQSISAQTAPIALQPPKDQVLLLHLKGKGNQIYVCQSSSGVTAWKLKAPDAKLYGETGELVGRHFAGPTWESTDGSSRVVAKIIASAPSPDSQSIPWLLLTMVSTSDKGIFSKVQSIQRLETKGGVAPSTTCTENEEKAVPYEAAYYFYGEPQPAAGNSR
jgi:hypothetical protein